MIKNINQSNQSSWQCGECGLKYGKKEWAEKCETWCREHKSCNLEITKHAIREIPGKPHNNKLYTEQGENEKNS